jgi:glycerophosphoryl diester phosphodiesterase
MNRLNSLLFLFTLLFLVSCQQTKPIEELLNEFHDVHSDYVMVAAHRGARKTHVENSISAIKHAIKTGVEIVEVDVKVTKDNVPILTNDRTINRTTNGTGNPEEYTWNELQKFRLKKPDGTLTEERIASLEEVLIIAKEKVIIDIDLKTSRLKPVIDIVKKTKTTNQVIFFHNQFEVLTEVLNLMPEAIVMPLPYSFLMTDSALNLYSPKVIHINHEINTPEVTDLISSKNAKIWINALGKPDDDIRKNRAEAAIDKLTKYGANIIQTDEPELMIKYLELKGFRNQ